MVQTRVPTRGELFLSYVKIGLLGFGGVAAWARHVIVEDRRWLTEREYAEILGLGQVLPGLREFITNNYLRGAITGLGLVNLWIALVELADLVGGRLARTPPHDA